MSGIVFRFNEKLDLDSSFTLEESKRSEVLETSLVGRCLGNIIGASENTLLQISQEIDVIYKIIFSIAALPRPRKETGSFLRRFPCGL